VFLGDGPIKMTHAQPKKTKKKAFEGNSSNEKESTGE
jgi:hypothetical protein